jgi:hypothetical protein
MKGEGKRIQYNGTPGIAPEHRAELVEAELEARLARAELPPGGVQLAHDALKRWGRTSPTVDEWLTERLGTDYATEWPGLLSLISLMARWRQAA